MGMSDANSRRQEGKQQQLHWSTRKKSAPKEMRAQNSYACLYGTEQERAAAAVARMSRLDALWMDLEYICISYILYLYKYKNLILDALSAFSRCDACVLMQQRKISREMKRKCRSISHCSLFKMRSHSNNNNGTLCLRNDKHNACLCTGWLFARFVHFRVGYSTFIKFFRFDAILNNLSVERTLHGERGH